MTWQGLVDAAAREEAEMDRLARSGAVGLPGPATIAVFVRLQRGMRGWKRGTLAGFADVSLSTIERVERGEAVSADSLDRVARALHQPPGAFTAPRLPLGAEAAWRRLEESVAPFEDTVAIPVRPLRGHRRIAELVRTHFFVVGATRLGDACHDDVATLREWLDLASFILAAEDKSSILQTGAEPVQRRKLYDDVLGCVRDIERRGRAVALSGTYVTQTGHAALPKANVALVGFSRDRPTRPRSSGRCCSLRLGWIGRQHGVSSVRTAAESQMPVRPGLHSLHHPMLTRAEPAHAVRACRSQICGRPAWRWFRTGDRDPGGWRPAGDGCSQRWLSCRRCRNGWNCSANMAQGTGMSGASRSERPIGTAHIFCDESGGRDDANAAFLAAAVVILPADAQRLVKSFRKATRIDGEIKGHRLTSEQRSIFFDLLTKQAEIVSAVVTCSRLDPRGGWAMGSLPEVELYSHLLEEACVALPGLATASHLTITPDSGRYKKVQLNLVRRHLSLVLAARHPHAKVNVGFDDSTALPGLQVADVIANSMFHSLDTTASAETVRCLLAPLTARGSLLVHPVRLERIRPRWLDEV